MLKNFFKENVGAVIGAYFDGDKIFIVRLTEKFETVEVEADGSEIEQLAEKISFVCRQKGWATSAVGFCLRADDAVTFQTEVGNVPDKEIPALVESWATAQTGKNAPFAFTKLGEELWMETLPRVKLEEFDAAFQKFGLNLRGLSVMPVDSLVKIHPFDRTEFITEVVRDKKAPNLLQARGNVWNWKKISVASAAIFFIAMIIASSKLFIEYRTASANLDAATESINELRDDLALKENLDADIAELNKLNKICAEQNFTPTKFNLLLKVGKISGGDVRLIEIRVDEKLLELEGLANTPDALKAYLSRVKNFVVQNARLENSTERDDGDIAFLIRASL